MKVTGKGLTMEIVGVKMKKTYQNMMTLKTIIIILMKIVMLQHSITANEQGLAKARNFNSSARDKS